GTKGEIPPDLLQENPPSQFYKAQCLFLPMDKRLDQMLKTTKSSINVFRMGVGGSFDHVDQYRYFFPASDRYCNLNPPTQSGERRVERFMNYLDSSGPSEQKLAPSSCVSREPSLSGFDEQAISNQNSFLSSGSYDSVVPDSSNYKFAHYGTSNFWARWDHSYLGHDKFH